jgi:hypothetical protein
MYPARIVQARANYSLIRKAQNKADVLSTAPRRLFLWKFHWGTPMVGLVKLAYESKQGYLSPRGGVQTALFANSTVAGTASLSNTTASYTELGGKFLFASIVGAETDHALFGYTVPTTHRFVCTGIAIDTTVAVALTTTASILEWGLGINSSAVSLATVGLTRIALGSQAFVASAAVGIQGEPIVRQFASPLVTQPGRIFHVIMREPVGAATGTFRGSVMVNGYFEPADDIALGG